MPEQPFDSTCQPETFVEVTAAPKETYCVPPGRISVLIERRLRKAEEFWRANPEATEGEAAFASGFTNQFYFSRVFR